MHPALLRHGSPAFVFSCFARRARAPSSSCLSLHPPFLSLLTQRSCQDLTWPVFPTRKRRQRSASGLRAVSSSPSSEPAEGESSGAEAESSGGEGFSPALGPERLQKFFELNAGVWHGKFLQFSLQGEPLQDISVQLTAATHGKGDLSTLTQTLRIQPGPLDVSSSTTPSARKAAGTGTGEWVEWKIPEMNRLTVDNRQQVGYFEAEGAYAMSHLTAEMLGRVLRVGILGEDADEDDPLPKGVQMPSVRPALVSEVCLSSSSSKAVRARAFHVLDPKGLIDTIAVFLEGQGEASQSQPPVGGEGATFSLAQLLGRWEGSAKVVRSELYGGTQEEQPLVTQYSMLDQEQLSVASTRGGRTLNLKAQVAFNVLQFPGGLQTVFLPGGMSFTFPQVVPRGNSFFFEFGWISQDGAARQRIVRTFDPDGLVVSTALLLERRA